MKSPMEREERITLKTVLYAKYIRKYSDKELEYILNFRITLEDYQKIPGGYKVIEKVKYLREKWEGQK